MKPLYLFTGLLLNYIDCSNIDGYSQNVLASSPIYDAYILSDLVDMFNDFDNNMNAPFDKLVPDSESDETVADLLFEYQHYLDKAHNQHLNYLEKAKSKNKVPLLRHDKYSKKTPGSEKMYNIKNYYSSYPKYNPNDIDSFETFSSLKTGDNKYHLDNIQIKEIMETVERDPIFQNFYMSDMSPKNKYSEKQASCYCRDNKIPCKCDCKQCIIVLGSLTGKKQDMIVHNQNAIDNNLPNHLKHLAEDKSYDNLDDKINIKIKVDVNFPKLYNLQHLNKQRNGSFNSGMEEVLSKESTSTVHVPFPFISQMNYPVPIDIHNFKKPFLFAQEPIHKITIHKKKKSRLNSNGKRHKNKKVLSLKFDSILPKTTVIEKFNLDNVEHYNDSLLNKTYVFKKQNTSKTDALNAVTIPKINSSISGFVETEAPYIDKYNNPFEIFDTTLNTSSNNINKTDDFSKLENSIETEISTKKTETTLAPLIERLKREVIEITNNESALNFSDKLNNLTKQKLNKVLADEDELLYWPNVSYNLTTKALKNITTLILERENKKTKLNMSAYLIHNNHSNALEQAIFGNVNWDDVDTVVPVFISFVGKYIKGILSFCSETMCHSMKCAQKICLHRTCESNQRFNLKGHCIGNIGTDSVAALESIMDLPSNIALEIVNILQDKMLGKMFGKATLCITSKCVTFVASKKTFIKSKCTNKELSSTGHCANMNESKVV